MSGRQEERPPGTDSARPGAVLRDPRPGELGWIVQAHGTFYSAAFGWGADFEGVVAGIVARFASERDDPGQRCWIADLDGRPVGCVLLTRESAMTGRLRTLFVDPAARGLGLGRRLTEAVIGEARDHGYQRLLLTTSNRQVEARRLYEKAGFRRVDTEPNTTFDPSVTYETWELELGN